MPTQQVIQFEYQQTLSLDSERARWSERLQASVRLTDAALTSGWLREHFSGRRGGANDFLVLTAIVMHARPLRGDDLQYLVGLGLARAEDEGCLYARITDLGLADELGMHRTTIAASAERLQRAAFIEIAVIPEGIDYRDSHGQFAGSKMYLLSGELQKRFLSKDLQPLPGDRVGLTDTVKPATVSDQATDRVGSTDINRILEEDEEDEFFEKIWQRFGELKGVSAYQPKPREIRLLKDLLQEGYTPEEILAGIDQAFQHRKDGAAVRHFGYCLPLIRAAAPGASSVLAADSGSAGSSDFPGSQIAEILEPIGIPEPVITVFTQANREHPPTRLELRRLSWLHEEYRQLAQAQGADAWEWILAALKNSAGKARDLLAYTAASLRNKLAKEAQAKSQTVRPPGKRKSQTVQEVSDDHPAEMRPVALSQTKAQSAPRGYLIPAEYSQAALQRALEQIPDDH